MPHQKGDYEIVIQPDGRWVHRRVGSPRALGFFNNDHDAWMAAQSAARRDHVMAIRRDPHGVVREEVDFRGPGHHPHPPHPPHPPRR